LANTGTFTEMVLDINKIITFGLGITPLVVTLGKVDLKPKLALFILVIYFLIHCVRVIMKTTFPFLLHLSYTDHFLK